MFQGDDPADFGSVESWGKAVACQGLPSADLQEKRAVLAIQMLQEEPVVIPHEGDHPRIVFLQGEDRVDYCFGIGTAIHVVTQENKGVCPVQDLLQQQGERSVASMDVTDYAGG